MRGQPGTTKKSPYQFGKPSGKCFGGGGELSTVVEPNRQIPMDDEKKTGITTGKGKTNWGKERGEIQRFPGVLKNY